MSMTAFYRCIKCHKNFGPVTEIRSVCDECETEPQKAITEQEMIECLDDIANYFGSEIDTMAIFDAIKSLIKAHSEPVGHTSCTFDHPKDWPCKICEPVVSWDTESGDETVVAMRVGNEIINVLHGEEAEDFLREHQPADNTAEFAVVREALEAWYFHTAATDMEISLEHSTREECLRLAYTLHEKALAALDRIEISTGGREGGCALPHRPIHDTSNCGSVIKTAESSCEAALGVGNLMRTAEAWLDEMYVDQDDEGDDYYTFNNLEIIRAIQADAVKHAPKVPDGWQPIEDCPEYIDVLLLTDKSERVIGFRKLGTEWCIRGLERNLQIGDICKIVKWSHLPPAPNPEEKP